MDKEQLLNEMIEKQRNDCSINKLLACSDLKRIIKYTDKSIFDTDDCCIWQGYVTNNKGKYINFYFNRKKVALHRLLYLNFKDELYDNSYLTFTCTNKGICCNLNHLYVKKCYANKNNIKTNIETPVCDPNIVYFD